MRDIAWDGSLTTGWDDIVDSQVGQGCKAQKLAGIAVRCVGRRMGLGSIGDASTTRANVVEARLVWQRTNKQHHGMLVNHDKR